MSYLSILPLESSSNWLDPPCIHDLAGKFLTVLQDEPLLFDVPFHVSVPDHWTVLCGVRAFPRSSGSLHPDWELPV